MRSRWRTSSVCCERRPGPRPVSGDRERLRATFDGVAELYERARPTYPQAVFDDLVELAGLARGDAVLEVGCGTGQATTALAGRGLDVTCVELGPRLASLARRNLAGFPGVEVVNAAFETWRPEPHRSFRAVVSFTAFHWVDPAVRFERSAELLEDGGALGVVETNHVLRPDGDRFWVEVQADYDAVAPSDDNRPPPPPDEVGDLRADFAASGRFGPAAVRRYAWDVAYGADEYVAVLDTYSGHRSMAADARRRLNDRIRRRIEARPAGRVTKTYLATLNVARRR